MIPRRIARLTLAALLAPLSLATAALTAQDAPTPDLPPAIYVPYDKAPEAGLAGKGVYLPYEQFVKLWDGSAPRVPQAAPEPPVGAVLTGYTLEGAVKGDYALFTLRGTATALAKGWSSVELPLELAITRFSADDPRAALERGDKAAVLHLPGPGSYPFTAEVALPIAREGTGRRSLVFELPAAPAGRLDLVVPDLEADVQVSPTAAFTTEKTPAGTRLLTVLGGLRRLNVSWQPPAQAVAGEALLLASEDVLATVAERSLRYDVAISGTVLRRPLDTLALSLPPGAQVLAVEAPMLRTWEKAGDRLVMRLREPVQNEFKVIVRLESLLAPLPPGETRALALPLPALVDAARLTGTLALVDGGQGDGVVVAVDAHEGSSQVDPAELGVKPAVAAFRFLAPPQPLALTVTRSRPELRAEIDELARLGVDEDLIAVELKLDVRKAGVFALACDVPAGWTLAEVASAPVAVDDSRLGPVEGAMRRLDLSLRSRLAGVGTVSLRFRAPASIPREPKATEVAALPVVRLRDAREQRGSLLVAAPRSWALESGAHDGLAGADAERMKREGALAPALGTLKEDEEVALAFAYVAADPAAPLAAAIKARPRARELALREEDLVSVGEGAVRRQVSWRGEVRYSPLPALRIQAPSSLDGQLVFKGQGLAERSVVSREKDVSTWELRFQAPVLGSFAVTVEQAQPLPALTAGKPATLSLAPLSALDATRTARTVAVAREGTLEVSATAAGMDALVAADLPASLQGPGIVAGFQGAEPAPIELTFVRHDLVPLADAAITAAHYQAVIGEDGQLRVRGQLLLATRGRPFLELRLPPKAELLEVAVDRHQGRPSRRDDGSVVVPLAPGAGPASQLVAFVYEQPLGGALGSAGRASVPLPEFGEAQARPLPVEGVELELYLPKRIEPLRWSGDLGLLRAPLGLWSSLLNAVTTGDIGTSTGSVVDDDGLTVKLALTGERYDLSRLGGGGSVGVSYLGVGLLRLLALALFIAGIIGIYRAPKDRRVMGALVVAAALAALLSAGAWQMPGIAFAAGVALALAAAGISALRERRRAWRASTGLPDDDPWLARPAAPAPEVPPTQPEPPASSDQPPSEPRP
jgi:hypothetical protein